MTVQFYKKLLFLLGLLAVLSPLGLLPEGDAWGEWSSETISKMIGYAPEGLKKFSDLWNAPFADYTVKGTSDTIGYMLSAIIGSLLIIAFFYIAGKIITKNR